jgi:outer membrane biosynthesis protein TonB
MTPRRLVVLSMLLFALVLSGCGASTPEPQPQAAPTSVAPTAPPAPTETLPAVTPEPTDQVSPLPTPALGGTGPSPLPTPTPQSDASPSPIQLVVLHTNDNWGETEPCG